MIDLWNPTEILTQGVAPVCFNDKAKAAPYSRSKVKKTLPTAGPLVFIVENRNDTDKHYQKQTNKIK